MSAAAIVCFLPGRGNLPERKQQGKEVILPKTAAAQIGLPPTLRQSEL